MICLAIGIAIVFTSLVPAAAGASPLRPGIALTASPTSVTLAGAARRTIRVANPGAAPVVVDVRRAGFALDPRGRPRVLLEGASARRAVSWLAIRPGVVVLEPGGSTEITLAARPPRTAAPGDHPAVVLLTTRPAPGASVAVRMRIGISVVLRVPGVIRHRLALGSLRSRHVGRACVIELVLANTGNAVERLRGRRIAVSLVAGGRLVSRLRPPFARELLPGSRGVVELYYRGGFRGAVAVRVAVAFRAATLRRSYRLKL